MARVVERLRRCEVATLVAVLGKLGIHFPFLSGLSPLTPAASFGGEAFTVRAIPIREDLRDKVAAGEAPNLHRQALSEAGAGQVIVFSGLGARHVSPLGDIIALDLAQRGIAGFVTDSGVNDIPGIAEVGLPVFAMGAAGLPGSRAIQVTDWQLPVGCAGVAVFPGDIVVGDPMGVVCIPRHLAERVADLAEEEERLEGFLREQIRRGEPLATTYPPNAAMKARYLAWKNGTAPKGGDEQ